MNNVEIQGGWSAPQPAELERGGKRWKDCKLLEISVKESNTDEIGDLMHCGNPGSVSELAQKVAR